MIKISELKRSISEKIAPCYILKGKDGYLRKMAIDTLKEILVVDYIDFNCDEISLLSGGAQKVIDALDVLPVLDEKRIVFATDVTDKLIEADFNLLEKYLFNPNENSVLVIVTANSDLVSSNGGKMLKSLEKFAVVVDCSKLAPDEIEYEVEKILSQGKRVTIEKNALETLVQFTGGDMQRIKSELEKLRYFTDGSITQNEVVELVSPEMESQIFELSTALGNHNSENALRILNNFFRFNVSGVAVLSVLINHFRRLLSVSLDSVSTAEELGEMLGVKPFAVKQYKMQAKNFTQKKLKQTVDYLEDAYEDVLKGKYSEQSALKNAVINLL